MHLDRSSTPACRTPKWWTISLLIVVTVMISACDWTLPHQPLTRAEFASVDFRSIVPERFWGDEAPPNLEEAVKKSVDTLRRRFPEAVNATPETAPLNAMLVISSGGANGAFGAGVIAGWSETGNRPQFEIVTGVSTGAMIAPFAFLGADYDQTLIEIYTSVSREKIFQLEMFSGSLFGSSLADTAPLKTLIDKYVTADFVQAIGEQTRLQRHLFIVTTHFDAMRPVVWDIGAIALNRGKAGVPLIRQIILASASIPILFPPVAIEWQSEGKSFTELHVDGGVSGQVFAYPSQIRAGRLNELLGLTFRRRIYLIQNGNAQLPYDPAQTGMFNIARRSIQGMLVNKENAEIERIYYLTKRDGVEFLMIEIPSEFNADQSIDFDRNNMRALLEVGLRVGRNPNSWHALPPGLRGD